jgi:hypothetical protein
MQNSLWLNDIMIPAAKSLKDGGFKKVDEAGSARRVEASRFDS